MQIVLWVVTGVLGLSMLAGLILSMLGRNLPERHTSRLTVRLPAARSAVWAIITDYARMPEWWPAVRSVRLETRPDGEVWTWNRDKQGQETAFRTKEANAPDRLVREIMGDDLPFGGTWTFALDEENGQTVLSLTEEGFIKPPLFRALGRYCFGLDRTMKDFAARLAKRVAGSGA